MNARLIDGDLNWYQSNINNYVDQIDLFVLALQHYAERKVMLVLVFHWRAGSAFSPSFSLPYGVFASRWCVR